MSGLNLSSVGYTGSLLGGVVAGPATGPTMPALNWLTRFSADTGLVNQVSGGPNLTVAAGSTPATVSNAYGTRAAWSLNLANPDYFSLSLVNAVAQHLLVAFVVTQSAFGAFGSMILSSNTSSPATYDQLTSSGCYIQNVLVGYNFPLNVPLAVVAYIGTDGAARMWVNGSITVGAAATAISAQTIAWQIGHYGGGNNWNYGGLIAAHCIAGGAYTDTDAANVGTAMRSYYGI